MRPHRRQPTRLPHPWNSPGKNAGVGCHFLLQCMKVKRESEVAQSCPTLSDPMDCSLPGSSIHGIFQARVLECGAIAFSGASTALVKTLQIHVVQTYSPEDMRRRVLFLFGPTLCTPELKLFLCPVHITVPLSASCVVIDQGTTGQ